MRPVIQISGSVLACGMVYLMLCSAAQAEDREFGLLVKEIETRYHAKRTHIPMFGLMKPMVKMSGRVGSKTLDMAIFENQDFFSSGPSETEFDSRVQQILRTNWQPMVRVHSRKDGERVDIYVKTVGKDLSVMLLTRERNEAVLLQAKLDPGKLREWLENPEQIGMATGDEISDDSNE